MELKFRLYVRAVSGAVCAVGLAAFLGSISLNASRAGESSAAPTKEEKIAETSKAVPSAVARDRAKLLHQVYAATLEVMHERYFHDERAIVPARALEDVFKELDRQTGVKARWISVNMKPMSIQHEPKGDFEKQAAAELSAGKSEFVQVEQGVYRRATPIPLSDGCVSCHNGHFSAPPKSPRFAGLIISIPLAQE